ncbi:MAG: YlbL family protein [Nocardioidaceae bacterium]
MSRRTASLTVASIALITLVCVAFIAPMPYVVMSPGVTENTIGAFDGNPVIVISGHKTYPTAGHLDLTTVSVTSPQYHPRLPDILSAWWSSDDAVLPRDVIYPPQQSISQVEHQSQTEMVDSQQSAVIAGLAEAGIDALAVKVTSVTPGEPAAGQVHKGDEIVAVDGTKATDLVQVAHIIKRVHPGGAVQLSLLRNGHPVTVHLTTVPYPGNPSQSRIGVTLTNAYVPPPFKVDISLGQDIGGPSAGMMFSLAIYDKLTPGDLTGGRYIAGTGTITPTGQVGPIGGIQQKIAGAYANGARYFLVPAADCAEATGSSHAGQVELIKVSTLNDSVRALKTLDSGHPNAITNCQ